MEDVLLWILFIVPCGLILWGCVVALAILGYKVWKGDV